MQDDRIEKAAIAVCKAQTNWAEPDPDRETVEALWNMQMDAVKDSFRRSAKAALDSQTGVPDDIDWDDATFEDLDGRMVEAVTVEGTVIRGHAVGVGDMPDRIVIADVHQPLLMRLPGGRWRLASGWKDLTVFRKDTSC